MAATGPYLEERRTELFIDNCKRFKEGRPLRNVVDKAPLVLGLAPNRWAYRSILSAVLFIDMMIHPMYVIREALSAGTN